jgi:hypothetical protein
MHHTDLMASKSGLHLQALRYQVQLMILYALSLSKYSVTDYEVVTIE